tara:strand:- start:2295 stop:2528 length:234 start_codon:yes stop_codon:yes gene_type:complete
MYDVKYPLWILNKIVTVLGKRDDLLNADSLEIFTYPHTDNDYKVDKEYTKTVFVDDKYGNKYRVTVEVLEVENANAI